ncbi:MAG: acyl-CoA dehydrogenase family protein [Dehalococcoidia bacterium]|jgi:cyclohexanecarboxyl-CoA dehydrogenase|nr:acyl-CoA dehydrogenase family protein [Dehalococcoidia bacterium]MDP7470095.1 acyl-CoA dehydrogenase family protein [Dehalococcoidia bacterium]
MSFGFNESQEMFRREMHNFSQKELAPGAKERAKLDYIPSDVLKKMAGMGLLGFNVPERYGGETIDWVSLGISTEAVGQADFNLSLPTILSAGIGIALQMAPEEVQAQWFPPVVAGETMLSLATTEPGLGSDVANTACRAVRDGTSYILSGEKTSVSLGMQSSACIVFAKTDPTQGARGVTAFLVPLEQERVSRSRILDMGCKPIGRASIFLDNVAVPESHRLGEEGRGFHLVMSQFDTIRVLLGLICMGAAQTSLDEAINYAKQRMAFGKPIGKFEGVSFKIAEAATMIEAGRLLSYRALAMKDAGQFHAKESAMVKWLCPVIAVDVIHNCLLIHGQIGYSEEYPLEQRLRDVMGFELADGTADIMKLIIVREIMGREYLPY